MKRPKNKLSRAQRIELLILFILLGILLAVLIFLLLNTEKAESGTEAVEKKEKIKLNLLNGCGYDKAAEKAKEYLINKDYENLDIISWGNVERNLFIYSKSMIVVKKDKPENLEYLMKVTGIKRRIYTIDQNSIEDFDIILGKDYRKYFE